MINRFKLHKTWIILGVALGIGVLAAVAARSYLSTQIEAIEARGKGKTINVVVAKRELKRGDKLNADSVAVRAIPIEYTHSAAILPESFERAEGQTLAFPLRSGEMVLWSLMEGKKSPTFSARVEVGHRAMTVPVDEINSISGMLEPGDLIDLMVTVDRNGKKITLPLLQTVQVMATGRRAVDGPADGEHRQYSTVTIDATPEQAHNVIVARDVGRITALLRNPDDKRRIAGGNADMSALMAGGGTAPTAERGIPVLYGGATMSADSLAMGSASHRTDTASPNGTSVGALPQRTAGAAAPSSAPR